MICWKGFTGRDAFAKCTNNWLSESCLSLLRAYGRALFRVLVGVSRCEQVCMKISSKF